jgi:hypothetical protein
MLNRPHMAMVSSAATSEYRQMRKALAQSSVQIAKLLRIAIIELFSFIQLRVTTPGSVRPNTPYAP